jgi:type I restriction enzyme S subunit
MERVSGAYLGHLLLAPFFIDQVIARSVGVSYPAINASDLVSIAVPVPPIDEQRAIASFLDCETAKIDSLIAEQEQLIALLAEKRQTVISHAVTKGLDPTVEMKDSGVAWLGTIPAHWDCGSLARISSRVVVGIAEAATHAYVEDGTPILRATNIRAGKIIGEILQVDNEFAAARESKRMRAGDLVTVRTGNAGVTAIVPPELDGCHCFTMLITSLDAEIASVEYYNYWANSFSAQSYFGIEGWGTAQVNISVPILRCLPIPIPPLGEQMEIVEYLQRVLSNLDSLVGATQSAIALLQERRTALISAAVTGKIDVREHAAVTA